jgi:CRISPR-associated endonuclease/helicase Cas3
VDQGQEQDETAGPAYCAAWLADNRKKSCLAAVGVGTVDQTLLAVLPSRYQALRLLGLGRSVLVVDEVHAYDPYMHGLLKRLLAFHAAQGGSAILLSATLPRHMRRELVQAYSEGLGGPAPPLRRDDYPLATAVSRGQVEETPLDVREGTAREVAAELCHDEAAMLGEIRRAVSAGACCCWVRNTVGDASAACETLRRELPEARVGLFHARFAMCDRLSIEDDARSRFGPGSIQSEREGRVLVATQVVEQSLDLDFDLVLSDLAPIELLIQRAGRCCRHVREDRPAGYGRARLVVLSPEPEEECGADWYTGLFPQGAYVYPFHGRMWLAARLLAEKGSIRLPEDARFYLEAVYGETGEERMPARLLTAEARPEGDARAGASFAHMNGLKLDKGYMADGDDWIDDVRTPTRLGQASVTLRLGRREGGEVRPWAGGEPGATAWSLSEVSVRAARISAVQEPADKGLREAVARATETMPDKGKFSLLLPLSQDAEGAWHGEALDGHGNRVRVRYGETFGLTIEAIT